MPQPLEVSTVNLTDDVLDAIEIIVNSRIKNMTSISNGIVLAVNPDGTYQVGIRGKSFPLKLVGGNVPSVNSIVKVFIPNNEMSQAFIIY